jgi:hypothetical protein
MTQTRLSLLGSLSTTLFSPTSVAYRSLAVGSLFATVGSLLPACDPGGADVGDENRLDSLQHNVIAYGQADWVQLRGMRDRSQVQYYGEFWRDTSGCNSRFGCRSMTVFLKLRVKPAASADLSKKKVGVVFREAGKTDPITVVGNYFSTHGDGYEEWHVPVKSETFRGTFLFTAWYENGAGGTSYDDNDGQRYAMTGQANDWATLSQDWASSTARFDATGVHGGLHFVVQDLDYTKVLKLVYSTDGWATSHEIGMGAAGTKNVLHWKSDLDQDFERWEADLDLPGSFSSFQCKLIYRHGVGGGTPAEFSTYCSLPKL